MEIADLHLKWETGTPLADAWFELLEYEEKRKYQRTDSEGARESFRIFRERQILHDLLNKKLIAIGIRESPPASAPIEIVPNHLFNTDSEIDWYKGQLKFSDIRFVQIRITDVVEYPRKLLNSNNNDALDNPIKKSGPKSAGDFIREEYARMSAEGRFAGCKTTKSIHNIMQPILERNKAKFPNGRGLAYSSFARHLNNNKP